MIRREFINRWGRWVLLGGLAGTAGYLTLSGKVSGNASCADSGKCQGCSRSKDCKVLKSKISDHHGR